MNLRSLSLAALSILALSAAPALADHSGLREKGREACKADVERFCKDVKPGGGRIIQCLKQHESELSAQCKAVGAEMKATFEAIRNACEKDAETYCKDMPKGPAKFICLKSNADRVSPTCKSELAKHPIPEHHGHHGQHENDG